MPFDFDTVHPRHATGSKKWSQYPDDVLPMWVADMDFAVAPAIVEALRERLAHPLLGYSVAQEALRQALVRHLRQAYGWRVSTDELVFLPGVEPGVNMALGGLLPAGAGVVLQTPNYGPLRSAPLHWRQRRIELPFAHDAQGAPYTDLDALDAVLSDAGAFVLSNPHNPLGKSFDRDELQAIARLCEERDVLVISDEIHADIQFDGRRHVPIASLGEDIARRTITLMSASKAFNIAGLKTAFAVIREPALRQRFNDSRRGMVDSVNLLGLVATRAAYADAGDWLTGLQRYLQDNRDYLCDALHQRFPAIRMQRPQSTYLAWLDCTALGLDDPQRFFLEHARVALSAGSEFAEDTGQFVRLNFGCPRALLEEGLQRMERAL